MSTPIAKVPETTHLYQIFIRNFTDAGTFAAAAERLDELRDLAIDWIYLTPIHPIGRLARKGSLGSPYAISDYRAVNPELGTEADFRAFAAAVHTRGWKLMIDVVYNHSSPDSRLAAAHPEWFRHGADGRLGRKCEDWSDVVDFDFAAAPALAAELVDTLRQWRDAGVDGFRCDVASLVPVTFWSAARDQLNDADHPLLWLAESVHPHFLQEMRRRGFGGWSEPELHAAFDLSYDYDGWERLERVWSGQRPLADYLDYIDIQDALYPASAQKIRYLENHDQRRAVERFGRGERLKAWTIFYQFITGATLSYMGQELATDRTPSLFEREPLSRAGGDLAFRAFFAAALRETRRAKTEAPDFSWSLVSDGVVRLERSGKAGRWTALLNLDDRDGYIDLAAPIRGTDVIHGQDIALSGRIAVPRGALLVRNA